MRLLRSAAARQERLGHELPRQGVLLGQGVWERVPRGVGAPLQPGEVEEGGRVASIGVDGLELDDVEAKGVDVVVAQLDVGRREAGARLLRSWCETVAKLLRS